MNLAGKSVIVTGAASGLGLAACCALSDAGATIAAFDRDVEGLERLHDVVAGELKTFEVDVSDECSVANGIDGAMVAFKAIHMAVNCAGVGDPAKTVSRRGIPFPLETWNKVIAINLTGTFNVIKLAAHAMRRNEPDADTGERGVIVNTASGAAHQGQAGQAAYAASKAGIIGLMLPVARDLAEHAIRVVTISPGLFETPLVASLSSQVRQSLVDKAILFPHRMGRASEFGQLVRSVGENCYLNATTIDLDAGARNPTR